SALERGPRFAGTTDQASAFPVETGLVRNRLYSASAQPRPNFVKLGLFGMGAALVLAAAFGAGKAASRPRDVSGLPADLAMVPADAAGFVTIRIKDVWGSSP